MFFRGWSKSIRKDANLQCIRNFLDSEYEFLLFLDSDAILEDADTFSKTVIQDLPVLSPALFTNKVLARKKQKCDFGWDRNVTQFIFFPDAQNQFLLERPRALVSTYGM